jgi:hypothetical protein
VGQVAALLAVRSKRLSLRRLADEVGVSKSAVDGLVQAYNRVREMPQPHANWQKLKDWYLREKYAESGRLSEPVDLAILALEMLADLPEAEHRAGVRKLADAVAGIYDDTGVPRPAWLARLARAAAGEETGSG